MMLVYFQDQLYDQPWCLQGQRSSPVEVEYAQVGGAHLTACTNSNADTD